MSDRCAEGAHMMCAEVLTCTCRCHTHPVGTDTCTALIGPVWALGGETCGCRLPADHVNAPPGATIDGITAVDHQCPCGAWWSSRVREDHR